MGLCHYEPDCQLNLLLGSGLLPTVVSVTELIAVCNLSASANMLAENVPVRDDAGQMYVFSKRHGTVRLRFSTPVP